MENQQNEFQPKQLKEFFQLISQQNILMVNQFLDTESSQNILQALQKHVTTSLYWHNYQYGANLLFRSLYVKNFISKFINLTDRSSYSSLYEDQKFLFTEKQKLKSLYINGYQNFKRIEQNLRRIKKQLTKQIDPLTNQGQEIVQYLFQNISDPFPPEPGLRKGNVGMFCNSGFQFYLVERRFLSANEKFIQQTFSQLKQVLEQLKQTQLNQNIFEQLLIDREQKQKIYFFFNFWYRINADNYKEYIIQNKNCYISTIHNILVYLITLFDTVVQKFDIYIESFSDDTYHQFLEFNVRYSIFRNTLLELQNQLSFLFQLYNEIYYENIVKSYQNTRIQDKQQENYRSQNRSIKISFWHCLLSKWYLYMKKRHTEFNSVYCYLLKKLNFKSFIENFHQQHLAIEEHTICLQNDLIAQQDEIIQKIEMTPSFSSSRETLEEQLVSQQLLKQYLQYIVDLSINQDSVHWCGHSDHEMHIPYQEYESKLMEQMNQYCQKIFKICFMIDPKNILFGSIINKIFYELDKEYLKPVSLKKLVKFINNKWGNEIHSPKSPKTPKSPFSPYFKSFTSFEEFMAYCSDSSLLVQINFQDRDKRLQYFNTESKIPRKFDYSHNIVIETEDFRESLKTSTDTSCSIPSNKKSTNLQKVEFNLLHKTRSCHIEEI